ncbi:ATP-binding protein [Streptomyces sp. NPDC020192]|uniref:ATP-binding protein n=1 Tax=Streptomyces sp. NPDC020192 TaxID=3365066 RepID=UPI0037A53C9D
MGVFQWSPRLEEIEEGMLSGAVERFTTELKILYGAAGEPTLSQLVRLGMQQRPPIKISDSTINTWLNAGHIPSPGIKENYFRVLVSFLQGRAEKKGHQRRSEAAWLHLLHSAREEKSARRGGRPSQSADVPQLQLKSPRTPNNLPPRVVGFVGRTNYLTLLLDQLDPRNSEDSERVTTVLSGMGGAGKTSLAIEAAYKALALEWFSGGILFLDMRGYSSNDSDLTPESAAAQLLRLAGVPEDDIPHSDASVLDMWRSLTDSRSRQGLPLLVILDNVYATSQIAALIPSSASHRVLITTRRLLASIAGRQLELDQLAEPESIELINQSLRIARPHDSRITDSPQETAQIASLCGGLPLALQIVSALLKIEPFRPLVSLIEELSEARSLLDSLEHDEADSLGNPLAVRAAFALSYRRLTEAEARAFRLLALAPGPDFSLETACVLLESKRPEARRSIRKLLAAHLLLNQDSERWTMHDLIRLYAAEKSDEAVHNPEASAAVHRVLLHFLEVIEEADQQIRWSEEDPATERFASRGEAWQWLDSEHLALAAAVPYAYRAEVDAVSVGIAVKLSTYFEKRPHADWGEVFDFALKAARRLGNPGVTAEVLSALGGLHSAAHQPDSAFACHRESLRIIEEAGGHPSEASILNSAGTSLMELGRIDEALLYFNRSLVEYRHNKDLRGEGIVIHNLASLLREVGDYESALWYLERDRQICVSLGDRAGEGQTLNTLGCTFFDLRRYEEAASSFRLSLQISRELCDVIREGETLKNLANAYADLGERAEALKLYHEALHIQRASGDRYREGETLMNLGTFYEETGEIGLVIKCLDEAATIFQQIGEKDGYRAARRWLQDARTRSPFHRN